MSNTPDTAIEEDAGWLDEHRVIRLLWDALVRYMTPDEFWLDREPADWPHSDGPRPIHLRVGKNGYHRLLSLDSRIWQHALEDEGVRNTMMRSLAKAFMEAGAFSEQARTERACRPV